MAQAQAARRAGVNIFDASKPMWQTILAFLVPLMLTNILQSLSGTLNSIYLGRMIGVEALAVASGIFPIIFLLISFLMGISTGSSVLIGQAFGAHEPHKVKKVAGTALGATFFGGILFAVFGHIFAPQLLALLGTPSNIYNDAVAYLRVIFWFCPLFFPFLAYTSFLRGVGDATTPFYFLIVTTVLSFTLTPVLIAGWLGFPHLGVLGAAYGGMLANAITFFIFLAYLTIKQHPLKFDAETARDMLVDPNLLWQIIRIGVPTGVQIMTVALAETVLLRLVNSFGSHATAAYGAVNQIVGYVQFPAVSIGIAASIFGAQCIGAKREDLLGTVVRSSVGLSYSIVGILVVLGYLLSWFVLSWFMTDMHTLEIAHGLLMITLWAYLIQGNSAILGGVMRGSGTVLVPTLNVMFAVLCVELPAAYLLMHPFGLRGIWMAYPIAYLTSLSLQFAYYELVWKHKTHERLI